MGPTGHDPYGSQSTGNRSHHWWFYSLEILRCIPRMLVVTSWWVRVYDTGRGNFEIPALCSGLNELSSSRASISHHICVLPIPGAPQISVIFVSGTPPPKMESSSCENVTTDCWQASSCNMARADWAAGGRANGAGPSAAPSSPRNTRRMDKASVSGILSSGKQIHEEIILTHWPLGNLMKF